MSYINGETQTDYSDVTHGNDNYIPEPHAIMKLEGYFIEYCYKTANDYFNHNSIFVPSNEFTIQLVQNIVNKSFVINRRKPLLENYFISEEHIKEFENIFKFSWVVKRYSSSVYDSLYDGYNRKNLSLLASERSQFHESRTQSKSPSRIADSIGIIFKLTPIEGVFKIEPYDTNSQMRHYDRMYFESSYSREGKARWVHCYGELRLCRLDYRFITPILSQVIAIEFKDRRWRRFVSQMSRTK